MKKNKFTTTQTEIVAVKVPLFSDTSSVDFAVEYYYIPLDILDDIKKNCNEFYHGAPLIPLSYYLYLIRSRKDFYKYCSDLHDNYL